MGTVRLAIIEDLPGLMEVAGHFWATDNGVKTAEQMMADLKNGISQNLVFLASEGNKIVGYLWCEYFGPEAKYAPNSVFLNELWVEEDFRNRGIGEDLVRYVIKQKFLPGYTYFSLTHDPEKKWLTDFYRQFGFGVVGKTEAGNVLLTTNR